MRRREVRRSSQWSTVVTSDGRQGAGVHGRRSVARASGKDGRGWASAGSAVMREWESEIHILRPQRGYLLEIGRHVIKRKG